MSIQQQNQSGSMNLAHLNNTALNFVEAVCSTLATPMDFILRPNFGTRYIPFPIFFFTTAFMLGVPAVIGLFNGIL